MNRVKIILLVLVIGGLGAFGLIEYKNASRLQAENDSLRKEVERLTAEKSAEPESDSQNSLTEQERQELLRLRAEVTQLRGRTNELAVFRRENEALRENLKRNAAEQASATNAPAERKKKSPEDALPQDIHPKNTWSYRGYDTPDAAIESMIWAMKSGDKSAFMAGLSPELQAHIDKDLVGKDFSLEMQTHSIEEFRILDRQTVSDDEMVVTVYTSEDDNGTPKGHSEDTRFKKVNGQWQVWSK